MKSGKKLIIYTDGSYSDGKCGWCFLALCNRDNFHGISGYGSHSSKNSSESEIKACIEALVNLRYINIGNAIEAIEIRTDFFFIVKLINNFNKHKLEVWIRKNHQFTFTKEILVLLYLIKKLPLKISAKKVNSKDNNLLHVHNVAKYALNDLPVDYTHLYIKELDKIAIKEDLYDTEIPKPLIDCTNKEFQFGDIKKKAISVPVSAIVIKEDIHLSARNINFGGSLKIISQKHSIEVPIIVREEGNNYILVAGMSRLCAAKLLGFETIPAILSDDSHIEYMLKYIF